MTHPPSELSVLQKVVQRLDSASIPYMLTGSMALNFYGYPRATNDFDIVIEVQATDEDRLFRLFENDFYISREAVREALSQERLFNIIDYRSVFKVDLIVRKRDPFSRGQFQRRLLKDFSGLKAYVISPEDLILAKVLWSQESLSEMQERDIQGLFRLLHSELDYDYLERCADLLGVLERLKRFYAPK